MESHCNNRFENSKLYTLETMRFYLIQAKFSYLARNCSQIKLFGKKLQPNLAVWKEITAKIGLRSIAQYTFYCMVFQVLRSFFYLLALVVEIFLQPR